MNYEPSQIKKGIGFKFALNGIKTAFKSGKNIRIESIIAIITIVAGIVFEISVTEWIAVILSMGLVFSLEIANTAIEELSNAVNSNANKAIGLVKDLAAGAVLVAAIVSVIVGLLIFVPKILFLILLLK